MNAAQHILIACLRLYRYSISPARIFFFGSPGQCRFTPSCSVYAMEAVACHGALAGSWLALKRLGRCHPWGGCGEDPVPARKSRVQSRVVAVHSPPSTVHSPQSGVASHG
jgi:putative membrane protein insertion efficiency factor